MPLLSNGPRRPILSRGYRIAEPDIAGRHDPCGYPAMAAHRVIAAQAEDLLHAGAGVAIPRRLQHRIAQVEAPSTKCVQADPANNEVAP